MDNTDLSTQRNLQLKTGLLPEIPGKLKVAFRSGSPGVSVFYPTG